MREAWIQQQFGTARAIGRPVAFGRARAPFSLVVDLSEDVLSKGWWRGAVTLAALILWALMLGPGITPLPAGTPSEPASQVREQWDATGVRSIAEGSRSGLRMAAGPHVEPITQAPERAFIDVFATVGGDGLARSLVRIGASAGDAIQVESLVRGEGGRAAPGTGIAIILGRKGAGGSRPVERVTLRTALDMRMTVERGVAGLVLTKLPIAVDRTPVRIRGRAGDGLYWALRAAGASSLSEPRAEAVAVWRRRRQRRDLVTEADQRHAVVTAQRADHAVEGLAEVLEPIAGHAPADIERDSQRNRRVLEQQEIHPLPDRVVAHLEVRWPQPLHRMAAFRHERIDTDHGRPSCEHRLL